MQVHASSGVALLLDGAEVAHAGVGASYGALAYLADIAASPGRGAPLVPALSLSRYSICVHVPLIDISGTKRAFGSMPAASV